MSNKRIVHISSSPLVGSPQKISSQTNRVSGYESLCVVAKDYPGDLAGKMSAGAILLSQCSDSEVVLLRKYIEDADVIHIHNDLTPDVVAKLELRGCPARFVYQSHSPLREGPLFYDRSQSLDLPFEKHLVVAQYQPRIFQDAIPVPNLIVPPIQPAFVRENNQKVNVVYSPSHARGGRWNSKRSELLEDYLKILSKLEKIDAYMPTSFVDPYKLHFQRCNADITFDEIVTGAFHQVALEGLSAANAVFTGADFFSLEIFRRAISADTPPPFICVNENNFQERLDQLIASPKALAALRQQGFDYFQNHLTPERLIQCYISVYEELL